VGESGGLDTIESLWYLFPGGSTMKRAIRLPRRLPFPVVLCVVSSLVCASPAAAYIDPGTGSLVLQMFIAGALGAAYAIKRFWRKIIATLRSTFKRS